MVYGLNRKDIWHPWLLERCQEVQKHPDGYLDLWARGHGKSSIITLGKTIQDILASHGEDALPEWGGREPTFGIFSCTRPIAKQFLAQIKREFESNVILRELFPDVIWDNPNKEAPRWSEDAGIIVKRKSNPKEATVEAWGIVEGQPTSKHFDVMVFDDVVTIDNVRSPQMIEKTTQAWELSLNLGSKHSRIRYIGTRYHYNDTYKTIMDRNAAKPRVYAATTNGKADGPPVFLSKSELAQKRQEQGPYSFASQMLMNPTAEDMQGFKSEWLEYFTYSNHENMNVYITVDPANEKKSSSDYTVMMVIGLASDNNYYVLDMIRDRLSLTERANCLFALHRRWRPLLVGYEKYGMQADIEYVRECMNRKNYHFAMNTLGGRLSKVDRIRKLIPYFEQHRIFLPEGCQKQNYEGRMQNLTGIFVSEEYESFPLSKHDDMLDALARILDEDMQTTWPLIDDDTMGQDRYTRAYRRHRHSSGSSWSA